MFFDVLSIAFGIIKLSIYKLLYPLRVKGVFNARFSHTFVIRTHKNSRLIIGKSCRSRGFLNIYLNRNAQMKLGSGVFCNNGCSFNSVQKIEIGDDVIFGENVKIYDHNHVFNKSGKIKEQGFSVSPVKIGENTWIGSNVTILKGVTIGKNCVIGANILINFNVDDNTIVKYVNGSIVKEKIIIKSK